jgi:hypothetical protein
MPDLKEVRAYHPAMSYSASDTVATPHSRHVSYPKALAPIGQRKNSMAKPKLINGLPHDLVQSFFSTLRYWDKGYMSDWIVNSAIDLKINKIKIDIIKKEIEPKEIEIKPIIYNINELDQIIDRSLTHAGLTRDYISQAFFEIEIFDNRYLKCKTTIESVDGKRFQTKDYVEKSYEIFKAINPTSCDRFANWIDKQYYKIRFKLFGRFFYKKLKFTKRLENMMK